MSEIGTLLLSSSLPDHIIVDVIYGKHFYKLKSPLLNKQTVSIVNKHFYLKKILQSYHSIFKTFPESSPYYFLRMLQLDIAKIVFIRADLKNDGYRERMHPHYAIDVTDYVSIQDMDKLRSETCVYNGELHVFLYGFWCKLQPEQKQEVYDILMGRFYG